MTNKWPGKKRTYHTGRKRCRYLKEMRDERAIHKTKEAGEGQAGNTATNKGKQRHQLFQRRATKRLKTKFRDSLGRLHRC